MDILKDRRVILLGGAAMALGAGLVVAVAMAMHANDSDALPPASEGGLMVQTGRDDTVRLDPARALRCFVNGRLAGEMPVSDCAHRNGVATGALDVGVDATGTLAAAATPSADVAPPPPPPADAPGPTPATVEAGDETAGGGEKACLSYDTGAWRRSPTDMSLNACVQSLFAGQCVRPGGAAYGRWGDRDVRLVLGKVEIAGPDGGFRLLARQQGGCAIPPVLP
jgi:hypothetical protein